MAETSSAAPDGPWHDDIETTQSPPESIGGIIRRLGPGLIIAGSIVGSGELIATTRTGAEAGFWLLWLIIIGCVIKVFAQIELGRYTIVNGRTAMEGMKEVPGPRAAGGNWLLWYWLIMFSVSLGQGGGIIGGVGQAMSISLPLSTETRLRNQYIDERINAEVALKQAEINRRRAESNGADDDALRAIDTEIANQRSAVDVLNESISSVAPDYDRRFWTDDKIWAALVTGVTVVVLAWGRYGLIQTFATVLVASFTLITIGNLFALQSYDQWAVTSSELLSGLSFRFAEAGAEDWAAPLLTAMATFGIIGVGANELIAYPYWCLEKGYARFTGPRDSTPQWGHRAQGWMRVMRWDAWCSMVVYTFATVAFYLLGAAVLGRIEFVPGGASMIRTLAVMYQPAFGPMAQFLFLFGAFAVLYSTFFVANAGHARVGTDALRVFGAIGRRGTPGRFWVPLLSVVFPTTSLVIYLLFPSPVMLVLAGGFMQFMMLPMLGAATLFFRYRRCDPRVAPSKLWDTFLWISAVALLITAVCGALKISLDVVTQLSSREATPVEQPPDEDRVDEPFIGAPGNLSHVLRQTPAGHSSLLKKSFIGKMGATAGLPSSVSRGNLGTAGQASSGTRLFQQAASAITNDLSLASECAETVRRLNEAIGPDCPVIVRAPFVISGDLTEAELLDWHRRTIAPAALAMAASYFDVPPNRPITVLLFSGREPYDHYAQQLFGDRGISVYGYYKPARRTLVMNIGTGGGTLVHELTHALVDFDFPEIPDWFNEGLASLHEQCRFRPDGSGIDGLLNWRLPDLQKAVNAGRLRSLESLVRDDDFRGDQVGINYAQARYFCLYMQHQGVLEQFYRRFRDHHEADPLGAETIADVFSRRSWQHLDHDFRRWVMELEG